MLLRFMLWRAVAVEVLEVSCSRRRVWQVADGFQANAVVGSNQNEHQGNRSRSMPHELPWPFQQKTESRLACMEHTGAAKTILRPGALQIGLWYFWSASNLGLYIHTKPPTGIVLHHRGQYCLLYVRWKKKETGVSVCLEGYVFLRISISTRVSVFSLSLYFGLPSSTLAIAWRGDFKFPMAQKIFG